MNRIQFVIAMSSILLCINAFAKDRHPKNMEPAQDQIEVVAHLPLTGSAITGFQETQHYRRVYLYAERQSGNAVSLLDVTSPARPALLAELPSESLVAVAGNAALVSTQASSAPAVAPQTFRIMSFADPLHPAIRQQFDNVTALARDEKRGLIFLANDSGIWVLQQKYAQDPEAEKEWEHMMLDNR